MSFSYAVTSQKSTAVDISIVCSFTSSVDRNLIIAKGNHIEIKTLMPDGLTLKHDITAPVFGRISAMQAFRPPGSDRDHLFVLVQRLKSFVLAFNSMLGKVETKSVLNLRERVGRPMETGHRVFLDPDHQALGLMVYEGQLTVLPIVAGGLREAFNVTLEETRVIDICFLHSLFSHSSSSSSSSSSFSDGRSSSGLGGRRLGSENYSKSSFGSHRSGVNNASGGCGSLSVGVLYSDNRQGRHFRSYTLDLRDKELSPASFAQTFVEFGSRAMIPIRAKPAPKNPISSFPPSSSSHSAASYSDPLLGEANNNNNSDGKNGQIGPNEADLGECLAECGVLIIGTSSLTYLSRREGCTQAVEIEPTQVVSFCEILEYPDCSDLENINNNNNSCSNISMSKRFLLGDHRGNLIVAALVFDRPIQSGYTQPYSDSSKSVKATSPSSSSSSSSTALMTTPKIKSIAVEILGETSIAQTIAYLGAGTVFIGSCWGDSQLIRLLPSSSSSAEMHKMIGKSDRVPYELVDTYPNIGPVLDMCLVDNEGSGGGRQLVTCSGAFKDGSLRVVRSGIGITEQASLEVEGITGVWSLKEPATHNSYSSAVDAVSETKESAAGVEVTGLLFDKYLVQSFFSETRVLAIDMEEMGETEIEGFDSQQRTLYCANMHVINPIKNSNNSSSKDSETHNCFVQVTPESIRLVDAVSHALIQVLPTAPHKITVASGTTTQLAVALSGGKLAYFQLELSSTTPPPAVDGLYEQPVLTLCSEVQLDQDVACISIQRNSDTRNFKDSTAVKEEEMGGMDVVQDSDLRVSGQSHYDSQSSVVLAVAMWTDHTVRLLSLPKLMELTRISLLDRSHPFSSSHDNSTPHKANVVATTEGEGTNNEGSTPNLAGGRDPETSQAQARDLLISGDLVEDKTFLLVGLGDGKLISYTLEWVSGEKEISENMGIEAQKNSTLQPVLCNKRKGVIGTQSISFTQFESGGSVCVFACCDRATVIYAHNGKLLFSVVNVQQQQQQQQNRGDEAYASGAGEGETAGSSGSNNNNNSNNSGDVCSMAPFHCSMFPECLMLGTRQGLLIGTIEQVQKLHVQKIPLGATPRRIAYSSSMGAYAVCVQREIVSREQGRVESRAEILFFDAQTMELLDTFWLESLESALSLACCVLETDAGPSSSTSSSSSSSSHTLSQQPHTMLKEYFVVGTAFNNPKELEPTYGRVLIFDVVRGTAFLSHSNAAMETEISSDFPSFEAQNMGGFSDEIDRFGTLRTRGGGGKLGSGEKRAHLVTEKAQKNAIYSIASLCGALALGSGSKVTVLRLHTRGNTCHASYSSQAELELECTHHGHILCLFLRAQGGYLLVGDVMRSVTLLRYIPPLSSQFYPLAADSQQQQQTATSAAAGEGVGGILEVARDYNSSNTRAVEFVPDTVDHYVACDDFGNLYITRGNFRQAAGFLDDSPVAADAAVDEELRSRLEVQAEFNIGDITNVFRPGTLVPGQPADLSSSSSSFVDHSASVGSTPHKSGPTTLVSDGFVSNSIIFQDEYGSITGMYPGHAAAARHTQQTDGQAAGLFSSQQQGHSRDTSDTHNSNTAAFITEEAKRAFTAPYYHHSLIYATISGAIGCVLTLNQHSFQFFGAIERALRQILCPLGELSHVEWRGYRNKHRSSAPKNVVDGDLVEMLLDLPKEEVELVTRLVNDELSTIFPLPNPAPNTSSTSANAADGGEGEGGHESSGPVITSIPTPPTNSTSPGSLADNNTARGEKIQGAERKEKNRGEDFQISGILSVTGGGFGRGNGQFLRFTTEDIIRRVEDIARLH